MIENMPIHPEVQVVNLVYMQLSVVFEVVYPLFQSRQHTVYLINSSYYCAAIYYVCYTMHIIIYLTLNMYSTEI